MAAVPQCSGISDGDDGMSARAGELPWWADVIVIPALNLALAFLVSGVVIFAIGESPWECAQLMLTGAFGSGNGIGYTLFYATNFIFTGLAFAVAFHAGLFNIGVEGQANIAGLGVALASLYFAWLPQPLIILLAIAFTAAFGAAWAFIPAILQAKRGSHLVITTIMFNYIAGMNAQAAPKAAVKAMASRMMRGCGSQAK